MLHLVLVEPGLIVVAIAAGLIMDGPDDDESYWLWALKQYGKFMAGTVPLLRDVASSFEGFAPSTVWSGGGESPARLAGEIKSLVEGKQTALKGASDITKVVTTVVPVPGVGNLTRVMDYMDSDSRGREDRDKLWFMKGYQSVVEGRDKNK